MSEQRPDGTGFDGNNEQTWWGQDPTLAALGGVGGEPAPGASGYPTGQADAQSFVPDEASPLDQSSAPESSSAGPEYSSDQSLSAGPEYRADQAYVTQGYPSYEAPSAQTSTRQDWATPIWTPPQPAPAASQTSASTKASDRRRRGIGAATLVGVAAMAATVGGGAGFAASRAFTPTSAAVSTSSTSTAPTSAGPTSTVTQVVQGNASAPDWKVTAAAIRGSVASIIVTDGQSGGQGSGVVLDTEGHIVTNHHVVSEVANGAQATVVIGDNTYEATLVGSDPSTDLAVLKLVNPPSDLKPMAIADSSAVAVGDPVMAFGNPLGLADTATTGIVSAVNRPVTTTASGTQNQTTGGTDTVVTSAIQTSAAINPGNSGGALVNANGELIGITSSGATLTNSDLGQSGSIGLGFAIPSNLMTTITDQLIENGTAEHAFVGISTNDATAELDGKNVMGASIVSVSPGTPAAEAGLESGDVITALNGVSVASSESLVGLIRSLQPGQVVELTIIRGGEEIKKSVTLGSR